MTPTGIVAVVLGIVIVVLSVALLIIWFRGNKKSRVLTNERDAFSETASELQSKISELKSNLEYAKKGDDRCVALTKQQNEMINELQSKISELEREHDTTIARYEDELKRAKESNRAAQSSIELLQRKNTSLNNEINTATARLIREEEKLSENMKNTITVDENDAVKSFMSRLNEICNREGEGALRAHISQQRWALFMDSIESGALTKWIKDQKDDYRTSEIIKRKLASALIC